MRLVTKLIKVPLRVADDVIMILPARALIVHHEDDDTVGVLVPWSLRP